MPAIVVPLTWLGVTDDLTRPSGSAGTRCRTFRRPDLPYFAQVGRWIAEAPITSP